MSRANGMTRQEILNSIKMNGTMTAEELSRIVGISQVAVRQHLASLEAEGMILVTVERRGLGRPSHRYLLTARGDESFPRRYAEVLNDMLDELRAWQGQEAVDELLRRRHERGMVILQSRVHDRPLESRLNELARRENEQGNMAEFCSEERGYRFTKRNCSVCAVALSHPGICCASEAGMISKLLGGTEVSRVSSIANGDLTCTFHISPAGEQ